MRRTIYNQVQFNLSTITNLINYIRVSSNTAKIFLIFLISILFSISFILSALILNPVPAIPSSIKASYIETDGSRRRDVNVLTLDAGRHRIVAKDFRGTLNLKISIPENMSSPKILMIRKGNDIYGGESLDRFRISLSPDTNFVVASPSTTNSPRQIFALPKTDLNSLTFSIENIDPGISSSQLIIDELGVYEKSPNRFQISDNNILKNIVKIFRILVSILGIFLIVCMANRKKVLYGTLFVFSLGLATYSSIVFVKFSPEWSRDLQVSFASRSIQNELDHEYYYGLYMANSILEGKGPLVDGKPLWYRMPGYGFLLSMLNFETSYSTKALLEAAVKGVWLQIFLIISSLTFFFWASIRFWPPVACIAAITGILLLPNDIIFFMMIESIMSAVSFFCLSTSSLFLWQYYKNPNHKVPLPFHLLLHSGFALWFFTRTDVLAAWFIVSILLYCRNFRTIKYLLIPTSYFLIIGVPWALFKMKYTGIFNITTESVGASFMGGLWEIPHKFKWEPTDGAYYSWIESLGLDSRTKAASTFALKECFRFCFTYPIYILSLAWHKFLFFLNMGRMPIPIMFFLTIQTIAFLIRYKRMQILLYGWMVFFNMPLFFVFYSSGGRFYDPAFISLIVIGCSLLFDRQFHICVGQNLKTVCVILIIATGILFFGESFDRYLIGNDVLRYWAPFLDPSLSTLNILGDLPSQPTRLLE